MTPTGPDMPQKPTIGLGLFCRDDDALRDQFRVELDVKPDEMGCIMTLANLTHYKRQPRRVTVLLRKEVTASGRLCGRDRLGEQDGPSWPEHTWTSIVGPEGREAPAHPNDPQALRSGGRKP